MPKVCVIIPNWNGKDLLKECLDSLLAQTLNPEIIVVENGSRDGSVEFLASEYPTVTVLAQPINLGFAGGVNVGIRYAIDHDYAFVALFNNDAVAEKTWLKKLVDAMEESAIGITTCTFADIDKGHLDSTGDLLTTWGLPYPRGRGEPLSDRYKGQVEIFGASGGASLYRVAMLKEIGLFDEDFFAYYEDVDISFRAQLRGWKVHYISDAVAYHRIGATSSKIKGFTTYQAMKNQPLVLYKNLPRRFWWKVGWRFMLARILFFARAISRGQGWAALRGDTRSTYLLFKKVGERKHIQATRKVSDEYVWSILTHDLPPNAHTLRRLRAVWWRLVGRSGGRKDSA